MHLLFWGLLGLKASTIPCEPERMVFRGRDAYMESGWRQAGVGSLSCAVFAFLLPPALACPLPQSTEYVIFAWCPGFPLKI